MSETKSLLGRKHDLASTERQMEWLNGEIFKSGRLPVFREKLIECGKFPLTPERIEIFQVNVGYMCNQVCKHCHVDAGPDRKEIMTRETMLACLKVIRENKFEQVDITGGAPEMNPDFRWFVTELKNAGVKEIMVRCNLTIIVANAKYHDLPQFYAEHGVRVISSLPHYDPSSTDRQRGEGVYERSIRALKMLNEAGYGKEGSKLILDLVYNPAGAFLPLGQKELEQDFKKQLENRHGILFNSLLCITNLPVSRFLEFLIRSGNYDQYMEKLVNAFNPSAVDGVMCRNTLSVGWDGRLFDCDFNQMLGLGVEKSAGEFIHDFDRPKMESRNIVISQHCYGCTAGAGSSCQGSTV